MDSSVVAVAVLFATVLLRVGFVTAIVWVLIPRRRACPHCGAATERVVAPAPLRLLRLQRRWCLSCGWHGLAKGAAPAAARGVRPTVPTGPLVALVLLGTSGCAPEPDEVAALFADTTAWIDLTYPFNERTIYWPTAQPFDLDTVAAGMTDAGFYYAANNLSAAEHGGTHLDAPVHFAQGRHAADQIPLARLVGAAVVVDVRDSAAVNADYLISVADLEAFEAAHGALEPGAIVLFRTGWGARWPDREAYLGTALTGDSAVPRLHFPGIAPDAARWLVARAVDAVGIDTPSIDYGQSTTFETHQILLGANIPGFENVANLDRLPPTGAYVIALPMKIEGGSGGPLRIVAAVPP